MRMTTKLISLLPILFVFFKFGEPALVMMSIYGDKGFYFDSKALTDTDIVGFVYDETNGAFAVANCTDPSVAPFKLNTDCTVVPAAAVAIETTATTTATALATQFKEEAAAGFPETSVNTNMMVAKANADTLIATTTNEIVTTATATLVTFQTILPASDTTSVPTADSTFLCNRLDKTTSDALFAIDATNSGGNFGQVKSVSGQSAKFLPIMKCVGALRAASAVRMAVSTFILIVTDHTEVAGRLSLLAFRSVVLLPQSVNQTTAATVVGYINGFAACPTGVGATYDPSTAPCKGTISIDTSGNYSFIYNGTAYYLPVTDASGATSCPATTTTTCEDFAFNFKYSNTLIGMLLIFMLKMLQSY